MSPAGKIRGTTTQDIETEMMNVTETQEKVIKGEGKAGVTRVVNDRGGDGTADPTTPTASSPPASPSRKQSSSSSIPQKPNLRRPPLRRHEGRDGVQVIDLTPPPWRVTQGASTPHRSTSRGSWKCPPLLPAFATVLFLGLAVCGLIYHRQVDFDKQQVKELLPESPKNDYFLTYDGRLEDEFEKYVYDEMNERYQQKLPPLTEDDAEEGEKKPQTDLDILKLASCRTTVRGVHYSGKLRQVLHGENITCLPWSLFDVTLYINQTGWGDVRQWTKSKYGTPRDYLPTRSEKHKIDIKLKKTFRKISKRSRFCRNYGGLFAEPSCLINATDARQIYMKRLMHEIQGSWNINSTLVVSCGVPICPDFFGPHAGQQCKVTQHGTESVDNACIPFRDFTPPGTFHCNITDDIHGPTYTWTHPSEGYSLLIPTRARRCHNLRRAVLVKGGYQSRVWFEIPVMKDYVGLRVHPYSDQHHVELILQYRYSADRADGGYNVGLTSRHFHTFHAQHLLHVSRGHVPLITDYSPLTIWKKILNVTHDKTVQYAAEDVVEAMNAGKVTEVAFHKKGKKAHLSFQDGRHTIKLSSPDETNHFPRFVRMFSDGLVEVQMDSLCPVVHVQPLHDFDDDLLDSLRRYKSQINRRARLILDLDRNPVAYFKHLNEGVYFSLQRKKYSTDMIFYHYYNGGRDNATVSFSSFPKLNDSLLLTLDPPYKFQLVKEFPQRPTEWETRQTGPFTGQELYIGWHGYSVTFTKSTFTLHHLSKRGKATLIYRADFLEYQPPVLYAFLTAAGGRFTLNCQPRYEEYMKAPEVSTQAKLTFTGTEYVGVVVVSRSGRLCFPSQHSPQGLCRTWGIGKMLYRGPACRVLGNRDFNVKLKQLGINGTKAEATITKE